MHKVFSRPDGLKAVVQDGQCIVNLTNHDIKILSPLDGGALIEIPQSGVVARIDRKPPDIEKHAGFPVVRDVYGGISGLPDEVDGTMYVVSGQVVNLLNDSRSDVVALGKQVRNGGGDTLFATDFRRQY